jgi:methionyl-tRNA formyltransferase
VLRVRVEEGAPGAEAAAPGTVVAADGDGPLAAAGDGRLVRLLLVKPANGRAMTGRAYLLGHDLRAGDRLG